MTASRTTPAAHAGPGLRATPRLDLLDAARVVAVIGVVAYHYLFNGIVNGKIESLDALGPLSGVARYGYLGVELFFMISGYVIFFSARDSTAQRFAVARALRLYPAFWFAVLFTSCVAFFWGGAQTSVTPQQVLANLSMLAPLFGQPFVDGVYWTLVYELVFYGAVFVALSTGQRHRLESLFIAWPVVMGLATLAGLAWVPLLGGYYLYFGAGALFAVLKRRRSTPAMAALVLCLVLSLVFSLDGLPAKSVATGASFSAPVVGAIIVSFYLLFVFLHSQAGSALRLPFARFGGALTYPLYLVHAHVGYMLLSHLATPEHVVVATLATAALVLAVACFIHLAIERRLRPLWKALFTNTLGRLLDHASTRLTRLGREPPMKHFTSRPQTALRIGIDGEALRQPLSGVGQYVLQLCRELETQLPHAKFFAYARLPADRLALPSARWTLRREQTPMWRRLPSFLWLKTRGAQLCRQDRLDIFWAGRTLHPRLAAPVRTVCTVHDLNHVMVPDTMEAVTLWSHRLWLRGDVARADCVLANSQGTAQRLRERMHLPVHGVLTPGLTPAYRPLAAHERDDALAHLATLGIAPPYLLSVATLEPRKNVELLFRAFLDLKRHGKLRGYSLVLAGARGWHDDDLRRELHAARDEGVVMPGFVPDALMPALYACAQALVFPSRYEGFGMPVLEARACGTRVVVADVPELREAGGPHAVVIPPSFEGVRTGLLQAVLLPPLPEPGLAERHAWRHRARVLAGLMQHPSPTPATASLAPLSKTS